MEGGKPESGVPDGTPGVDAGDRGLPWDVLAVFARATPTMSDCIQITPLAVNPRGPVPTAVIDVARHMELDGHLTDARLVHSSVCFNAVVVRRTKSPRGTEGDVVSEPAGSFGAKADLALQRSVDDVQDSFAIAR